MCSTAAATHCVRVRVCLCVCVVRRCTRVLMKRDRLSAPAACGVARHREWVRDLHSDYEMRVRASAAVDKSGPDAQFSADDERFAWTGSAADSEPCCGYLADLPSRFRCGLSLDHDGCGDAASRNCAALPVAATSMAPLRPAIEAVDAHWLQAHPPLLKRQKRWADLRSQLSPRSAV